MKNQTNTKSMVARYIFDQKHATRADILRDLEISMPTVIQNIRELTKAGLIEETGETASTGGRKAKTFSLNSRAACAAGLDITANHIGLVLMGLDGAIVKWERKRKPFVNSMDYYSELKQELETFFTDTGYSRQSLLGIGISLPGIVDNSRQVLLKSHALQLEQVSLDRFARILAYPVYFENDASAAMLAEQVHLREDAIYLFLSNTVGGAISFHHTLFVGDNHKAGEFGHMVLVPGGRRCYCGKLGCMDAYCSPLALTSGSADTLEQFMEKVNRNDPAVMPVWNEYLEHLAIAVTNLRMAYDMDIILGGYMGKYLEQHMLELGERTLRYNLFDRNINYLKSSYYKDEGSAAGAAIYFINHFINHLE